MRSVASFVVAALYFCAAITIAQSPITVENVAAGNTQFQRTCAQCHGRNLVSSGTSAPDLRRFPTDQETRFNTSVTQGEGNMPAFREHLTTEQIASLWVCVATRGGKEMPEVAPAAVVAPAAPISSIPEGPLTVCIAEDNAPLTYLPKASKQPQGLDVRVAEAIALRLDRPLKVVLFESKFEQETTLSQEANALLSSGVCDLVSGFPLIASDLGRSVCATARVPDHPGASRRPNRAWAPLKEIVGSTAYHASALTMIVRESGSTVVKLEDLKAMRIGAAAGSLSGAVLMMSNNGALRSQVTSFSQQENLFSKLEAGSIDAILVPSDQFDAWRLMHPATTLRRTEYVHPLRINLGLIARADAATLLAAVNAVVSLAKSDGSMSGWAQVVGATLIVHAEPNVHGAIGLAELAGR